MKKRALLIVQFQQRLGVFEIGGIEAFREPRIGVGIVLEFNSGA